MCKRFKLKWTICKILLFNLNAEEELSKLDINTNLLRNIEYSVEAIKTEIDYV